MAEQPNFNNIGQWLQTEINRVSSLHKNFRSTR